MEKGRKLNDTYTLIDEIGSGGGGVVYRAYHERLKTYVVVKKIKEKVKGILDGRAEADILKRIKHTYLPRVYDFLEIDDEIYTVMDYIPGKSLDRVLAEEGNFPQKQVLVWAIELSEALEYLHSQNPPIIHSDIKPANIMLTPEGKICLIDFNISLAFDSSMKNSVGISGGYSSPEQYPNLERYQRLLEKRKELVQKEDIQMQDSRENSVTVTANDRTVTVTLNDKTAVVEDSEQPVIMSARNESGITEGEISIIEDATVMAQTVKSTIGRGVDERSDIYSLGATLYHLITGKKPSNNFEKIVPIDECDVKLSEGFVHILKKMMEFCPEDRYQNGGELLQAFRNIYELDTEYKNYKKRCRNRKMLMMVLYLIGVVLLGSGWTVRQREKDIEYNRNIMQAEAHIEAGDFEEASAVLVAAMQIRPERIDAYEREVIRLYQFGNYDECIRYAVDFLQNPSYRVENEKDRSVLGNIYYVLGNCYIEKEDYINAELNLKNAINQYDQNSHYYRDYAIVLTKQGKIQDAEFALGKAFSLHLEEDSIYMVQGEIAFAKGEYEKAEEYLLHAIFTAADDNLRKRAVLLCDRIYRELGDEYLDREIVLLEQEENRFGEAKAAMNISERLADAYARKAEADESVRQKYYGKAIERFEFLYDNGYATKQIMENIAILYEQSDDYEKAEEILQQMLEQYPDSYVGYKRLAYLEADVQKNKENANRNYKKMKEYYDKAKELYNDEDHDEEMQMLDHMIADLRDGNWL